jgi:heptosyltransferase-2
MVMAQSLFIRLKRDLPDRELDVLAPAWSRPLLARMPQVANALTSPFQHGELAMAARRRLGRTLRRAHYAQAIVLPNSFKSALVPWFAGIPRRTGWRGEWRHGLLNDVRVLDSRKLPRMVQRFVALGGDADSPLPEPLPVPRLVVDPGESARCRAAFSVAADRPLLALCPGAEFGPAKCWPPGHYADLARSYIDRGWQVLLLGSDSDRQATGAVKAACGDTPLCLDLAGRTSLAEVVDLLALADAVVTNDSGLMHVAAALARPLVALFGATSPDFTPPLGEEAALQVSDIECAPCFQRTCPLGHHRCMRDIRPVQVAGALDGLLAGGG